MNEFQLTLTNYTARQGMSISQRFAVQLNYNAVRRLSASVGSLIGKKHASTGQVGQ